MDLSPDVNAMGTSGCCRLYSRQKTIKQKDDVQKALCCVVFFGAAPSPILTPPGLHPNGQPSLRTDTRTRNTSKNTLIRNGESYVKPV
jgi:hypothetical protein